jgi:hypothetical protein
MSIPQTNYQVIVGNIGTVYDGPEKQTAQWEYEAFIAGSESGVGRCGGEDVTLMKDGDIEAEFYGTITRSESD